MPPSEGTHSVPAAPVQSGAVPSAPSGSSETNSGAQLALLSSRGYQTEGGGYYIVEGEVRNISGERLADVEAVASWYASNGTFITSDSALIDYNPIMPGQTSPFKVMSTANPEMDKYSVGFKTVLGLPIATSDERAEEAEREAAKRRATEEKQQAAKRAAEQREREAEAAQQGLLAPFRYRVAFRPGDDSVYDVTVDGRKNAPPLFHREGFAYFGVRQSMLISTRSPEAGFSSAQVNGQAFPLSWHPDGSGGWTAWVVRPAK
jgi:hypothetical protein